MSNVYKELDIVTTPSGRPVVMVHCNTCTSDLDAWVRVFAEFTEAAGASLSKSELYDLLYNKALEGDADCGGLVNFNYYSGEPITGVEEGRPLFVRKPDARLTLANFMRSHLFSCMATLKIGMDILDKKISWTSFWDTAVSLNERRRSEAYGRCFECAGCSNGNGR